jgi:hypothetical protein
VVSSVVVLGVQLKLFEASWTIVGMDSIQNLFPTVLPQYGLGPLAAKEVYSLLASAI